MQISSLNIKEFFFLALLVVLGYVMLQLFAPFMDVIIIALVIVQLFYPVYKWVLGKTNSTSFSSTFTTILAILLVLVPLTIIALLAVAEITNIIIGLTENGNIPEWIKSVQGTYLYWTTEINRLLTSVGIENARIEQQISIQDLQGYLVEGLNVIRDIFYSFTTSIINLTFNALFYGFLLIITLLYLFAQYTKLPELFSRISPLDDKLDTLLVHKFTDTAAAVIKGTFFVSMAQATSVIVLMSMMGIGSPVLLWLIMVLFSIIPIGSGIVWLPTGFMLIVSGRVIEGIILIVYGAVVTNIIEVTLRPYLIKGKVQLHPLLILFSVLGGITMFGMLGILYGPLIAVFFTSLMDIYFQHFAGQHIVTTDEHVTV